ncbi:MAG: DUF2997 domain-containing protein [Pirellulales bacterium]|nr:DUF2997 domain-containing protein [Pirellulales bacterium]
MTKTIELVVSPTVETTIKTKGFAGAECQDASRFIEQALGRQINERLTAEFHSASVSHTSQQELRNN